MKAGIYDLDALRYYADDITDVPTLNATVMKALIRYSPRHAWERHPKLNENYAPEVNSKFDIGSATHEVFLLGNKQKVAIAEFADWRTKAAQAIRDEAREQGKIPLLAAEWERVCAMLDALKGQLDWLEVEPAMFATGKPEQTIVWQDDHDVWCRARLDWLHDDHTACDDLKTCKGSASPLQWASRTLFGMQAEIQAALTIRGIRKLTGVTPEFRFLACEVHPPHAISAVRLSPAALELANRQINRALIKWRDCLASDKWPSYPARIVDAEPPGWAEMEMWQAEQLDEAA